MTAIAALACLKVMQLGNSLLNVLADLLGSRKITYFHPHVKLKPNQKLLGFVVDKHDWNTEEEAEEEEMQVWRQFSSVQFSPLTD